MTGKMKRREFIHAARLRARGVGVCGARAVGSCFIVRQRTMWTDPKKPSPVKHSSRINVFTLNEASINVQIGADAPMALG